MIRLLLLLLLAGPAQAADLDALRAAAEASPQDYATQIALARAADEAGERALAATAWQAAFEASGGNLEASLGRALALANAGRIAEARRGAAAAVAAFPDSADAHKTQAWLLRFHDPILPGTYGLVAAERSYARAFSLFPDADTRCGLGWTRLALGAPLSARQDFAARLMDDPGDPCAVQGTAATRSTIRFGGGFSLNGAIYQDHPTALGGFNALISGHVSFADLVSVELVGRFLGIAYQDADSTRDYRQDEVWGRVGVAHGGFGGQVLAGAIGTTSTTKVMPVVAGRGWFTFGPTLRFEGTVSAYDDGDAVRGGFGLRVPVLAALSLDGGLDVSALVDGTTDPVPRVSAHASALVQVGPVLLQPGIRLGDELRPVRIDEPSAWNTTDIVKLSAYLKGTAALNPHLDLTFGYEILRLDPEDGSDVRHTHLISLGLTGLGSGGLRK